MFWPQVREGEVAAAWWIGARFPQQHTHTWMTFKAVLFSARLSPFSCTLALLPSLFRVSSHPSVSYGVSPSFSLTSSPNQVLPTLKCLPSTPCFLQLWPSLLLLTAKVFQKVVSPCGPHMFPSHLLLNSFHSVFHPHHGLKKASAIISWPLFCWNPRTIFSPHLPCTSAVKTTPLT